VAPATTPDGASVVYKITIPHDEARGEGAALAAYAGNGAVRLIAHEPSTLEILMERAEPGHDLWNLPDDGERLTVACELMRRLWRPLDDIADIDSLADVAPAWAAVTERRLITSEVPWTTEPIERGIDLLRSESTDGAWSVLLHGDLHPGNILAAERHAWLAIDPKPLVGDRAFEPVQILTQCNGQIVEPPSPDEVSGRLETIADLCDLDAVRIGRWAIGRCAEWSMWSWEHGHTVDAAIAYTWARVLDQVV
jgi:streptomycin 6-kinase